MQSVVAGHLSLYITLVLRGEWTKARAKKKSDGGSEQLGTHVSSTPSTGAAALALCRPDTAPSSRRGVSVLTPSLPSPPHPPSPRKLVGRLCRLLSEPGDEPPSFSRIGIDPPKTLSRAVSDARAVASQPEKAIAPAPAPAIDAEQPRA